MEELLTEEDILTEGHILKNDIEQTNPREKYKVYHLTLEEEAKILKETPELLESIRIKVLENSDEIKTLGAEVKSYLLGVRQRARSEEDILLLMPFIENFYEPLDRLNLLLNQLFYWQSLISCIEDPINVKGNDFSIEELRNKDIVIVAESLGIVLKNSSNLMTGLCPLHEEKTPSFTIYPGQRPNKNSFYCFGCNEGGDVITLVMKVKKINFIQALKYLKQL